MKGAAGEGSVLGRERGRGVGDRGTWARGKQRRYEVSDTGREGKGRKEGGWRGREREGGTEEGKGE